MRRLGGVILPVVILAGTLAGCTLSGGGDLVVRTGETVVKEHGIEIYEHVTVERGGQLILRGFSLRPAQSLVVEGRLEMQDGDLRFSEGNSTARLLVAAGGELIARGTVLSGPGAMSVDGGNVSWSGGHLAIGALSVGADGVAAFYDTDVATDVVEGDAEDGFTVAAGGSLYMRNTSVRGATIYVEQGGHARLISVGLAPAQLTGPGLGEVGWPVTVHVRTPSGPAANVAVEVRSVPAGDLLESSGTTGGDGVVILDAIEYAARDGGAVVELRNPHRVAAPGRTGVGAAVAVQGASEAELVIGP